MSAFPEESNSSSSIQLLLFIDERSQSTPQYQEIISYFDERRVLDSFELEIIDVSEQPDLAEYFKLQATPTLIKVYPFPKQMFAGSNLINELLDWWPEWVDQLRLESLTTPPPPSSDQVPVVDEKLVNVSHISKVIRLSDEVFQLRQQQEELSQQLRFKDQVINMLAHDLRNPLTAAALALDTLAIAKNPEDQRNIYLKPELMQKLVQRAREQMTVVDRLISDILQLSEGAVADIKLFPQRLDLNTVVEAVMEQMAHQLEEKQQLLITDIPQDLPPVYADVERVRQVLVNLLDNASKYTPPGGKIRIAALHRTHQKIQINVIDDGAGIPAADCELIFQKHYRLPRDHHQSGYGLGLPVCKSIISAHYGKIWVESSAQGSSFNFTLPVHLGM
jgi:two-component system, OmpR family, clock-associated histidine kinase SasA